MSGQPRGRTVPPGDHPTRMRGGDVIQVQGDWAFGRGIGGRGWSLRRCWSCASKGAAVSGRLRNRGRRLLLTSVMLAMLLAWGTAASAAPGWTVVPTVDPSASTN